MSKVARLTPNKIAGALAVTATALAIYLHLIFGMNAGALWRDEVNSLNVATMRTFGEMWANLSFDSFPALYFLILRLFAGVPATASDAALRGFGVAIGLLILGAVWLNAKWLRLGFPLLTLALIGLNPMVIRYSDSIRSYGLGILLALLMFGTMWRLLESFTLRRVLLAGVVALLSVQSLYYNSFLLFAVCMGAVAVTLLRRQWKQTVVVVGIGAVAALSLLPYLPTMRRVQSCSFMWKRACTFLSLWQNGTDTMGAPLPYGLWLWSALFVVAVGIGIWMLAQKSPNDQSKQRRERLLFALVTLVVGTICYACFLRLLSYIMQPWYYVAFIAFAATCMEMIFASAVKKERALLLRGAFALLLIGVAILPAARALEMRQTNIDQIASSLDEAVGPDDLIVINTWNYGISFRRYYHGAANFTTVPPMEDLRSHRVDLAKQQMMSADPLAPVLQKIESTLRAGHTVWLIGGLKLVQPGEAPLRVPPGFDGPQGWVGGDFYRAWSEQVSALTRRRAESFQRLALPSDAAAMRFENLPLSAFRGWRAEPDDSRLSYF